MRRKRPGRRKDEEKSTTNTTSTTRRRRGEGKDKDPGRSLRHLAKAEAKVFHMRPFVADVLVEVWRQSISHDVSRYWCSCGILRVKVFHMRFIVAGALAKVWEPLTAKGVTKVFHRMFLVAAVLAPTWRRDKMVLLQAGAGYKYQVDADVRDLA